ERHVSDPHDGPPIAGDRPNGAAIERRTGGTPSLADARRSRPDRCGRDGTRPPARRTGALPGEPHPRPARPEGPRILDHRQRPADTDECPEDGTASDQCPADTSEKIRPGYPRSARLRPGLPASE